MGDAKRRKKEGLLPADDLEAAHLAEDRLRRLLSLPEFGLCGEILRTRAWLNEALDLIAEFPTGAAPPPELVARAREFAARFGDRLDTLEDLRRAGVPVPDTTSTEEA